MDVQTAAGTDNAEQLKALLTYTTFHIGMYITLSSVLIGLLATDALKQKAEKFIPYLWGGLGLFVIAGAFGGLVGSSIPRFKSYGEFEKACLGPWGLPLIPAPICAHLEHTFFWVGIVVIVIGLFVAKKGELKRVAGF